MVLAGWKGWLYLLVGVWAYYHVIRQHYGFMVLYKVKKRDLAAVDNALDRMFLGVMLVMPPFHRFLIHHPEELGIPSFPWLETPMFGLVAGRRVYLGRQWRWIRGGDAMDVPKYLLFAAVIPLHWLTFAYMSWQAAVPTVTIVHNLQYHAIVWFHNRNRYAGGCGSARTHPRGGQPQPAGLRGDGAGVQPAVPDSRLRAGKGVGPGVRLLLRFRVDALLSRQPHLARAPRSGPARRAAVGVMAPMAVR